MTKEDIIEIINYWCELLETDKKNHVNIYNNKYEFLPLRYVNNIHSYFVDTRLYFDNKIENDFTNCRFIKKNNIGKAIIGSWYNLYSDYCKNVNLTAIILWDNHNNKYNYFIVWLYSLCVYILDNEDKINFCTNTIVSYLEEIIIYLKNNAANDFNIDMDFIKSYYYKGNVLPDGLLKKNYYTIDNGCFDKQIHKQIHRILFEEMLYIMNDNYLCVFAN